jgi:Flp pilus assembly protein TadG
LVTTELAILTPVFLVLLFLLVQAGLFFHARNLARVAAQEAALVASVEGGNAESGRLEALKYLEGAPSSLWQDLQSPEVSRGVDTTRAEVRGTVQSVVPFSDIAPVLTLSVHEVSERPTERFVPDT